MADAAGLAPLTVRAAVFDLFRSLGITTIFGNPGSTELPFLNEWPSDFRYVLGLQEASVIGMADGYARATGNAGVLNLHSAVGVGHALGNLFTSARNNTPLVITAGQQARALLPHAPFLGAERASEFPRPYVKWAIEPARAADVPAAIAHAYHVAMQRPRGPTFVSIPIDDWAAPCRPVHPRTITHDVAPDPAALARLAAAIAASRRPAFVVGPAVDEEGAWPAAVALAERARAAVWVAPFNHRASFPEDHPLFAGHLKASPAAVAEALAPHDLIVVFGAPVFTFHVDGDCALFAGATPLWMLTQDPEEAARAPIGDAVIGSLRLALPALLPLLPDTDRVPPAPLQRHAVPTAHDPIPPNYVMAALARALPPDALLMEEAPSTATSCTRTSPSPARACSTPWRAAASATPSPPRSAWPSRTPPAVSAASSATAPRCIPSRPSGAPCSSAPPSPPSCSTTAATAPCAPSPRCFRSAASPA